MEKGMSKRRTSAKRARAYSDVIRDFGMMRDELTSMMVEAGIVNQEEVHEQEEDNVMAHKAAADRSRRGNGGRILDAQEVDLLRSDIRSGGKWFGRPLYSIGRYFNVGEWEIRKAIEGTQEYKEVPGSREAPIRLVAASPLAIPNESEAEVTPHSKSTVEGIEVASQGSNANGTATYYRPVPFTVQKEREVERTRMNENPVTKPQLPTRPAKPTTPAQPYMPLETVGVASDGRNLIANKDRTPIARTEPAPAEDAGKRKWTMAEIRGWLTNRLASAWEVDRRDIDKEIVEAGMPKEQLMLLTGIKNDMGIKHRFIYTGGRGSKVSKWYLPIPQLRVEEPPPTGGARHEKVDTDEWLLGLLANGPVSTTRIKEEGEKVGVTYNMAKLAKVRLGIQHSMEITGGGGKVGTSSEWFLPPTTTPTTMSTTEPAKPAEPAKAQENSLVRNLIDAAFAMSGGDLRGYGFFSSEQLVGMMDDAATAKTQSLTILSAADTLLDELTAEAELITETTRKFSDRIGKRKQRPEPVED